MQDLFSMRAVVFKALAHPTRLRVVDWLLTHGETCVCEMADQLQQGQPTISKHLGVLKEAGIVASTKDGSMVRYRVTTPCVAQFFQCIDEMLRQDIGTKQAALAVSSDK